MTKNMKSLGDLEIGIKQLLLENRCSFSEEEKVLLLECLIALQQANELQLRLQEPNYLAVVKVVELLTKLFIAGDHFRDFL